MNIREPAIIHRDQMAVRNGERQRQQAVQGKTEEKSGEKQERRPRDDARGCRVVRMLSSRVHTQAPDNTRSYAAPPRRQLGCHFAD